MLSESVFAICGAGRGLGEATAIELGRHGATVIVNDLGTSLSGDGRDEEPAQQTVRAIENAGGTATAHCGDVASMSYAEELVSDAIADHGRLDGIANFAGIVADGPLEEMSTDEWDRVVRVHLRSNFVLLRAATDHWKSAESDDEPVGDRSFLAVTSRAALGSPNNANYAAAKAGILGLVRTAARELAESDIRVNSLMPTAYTRMIEHSFSEDEQSPARLQAPEKVAPAAAYLLSNAADGVTGCTIRATGESVGLVSDPAIERLAFREGGWTVDALADKFRDTVSSGINLNRQGSPY